MPDSEERKRALVQKALRHFLLPPDSAELLAPLDDLVARLGPIGAEPGRDFRHNLQSVVSTAGLPFAMAAARVHALHLQRLEMAARIHQIADTYDQGGVVDDERAAEDAQAQLQSFQYTPEGSEEIAFGIFGSLVGSLEDPEVKTAASELLNQGAVLLWGAFEVLARDIFERYLDNEPRAVLRLAQDESVRRRFDLPKLSLTVETLADHGFDLSRSMGRVLTDQRDLSDLPSIRAALKAVFDQEGDLHKMLGSQKLWQLSQDRHLLVHRRGTVDQKYLDRTGSALGLGAKLQVPPRQLKESLTQVRDTGVSLLDAVGRAECDLEAGAKGGASE